MRFRRISIRKGRMAARVPRLTSESLHLGILLAIVGGYLDSYTFLSRGGVFANAQTGNIVLLGIKIAQGNWTQALLHIPPILAFVLGVGVVESFKSPRMKKLFKLPARAILLLEIAVLIIVGMLPEGIPNIIVTVVISFVASLQVSSFRKLITWSYNTTMTTGNLRTATQAAYRAMMEKNKEAAGQALKFYTIIGSFLFGALGGGILTMHLENRAIWIAAVLLVCAFLLLESNQRIEKEKK
ncbi:YoaK family protein [Heyndrickxia acidicola]|uniref:YoaK family protein n=2 Tax=Heyndrickxia acidicola TaxID=209389 RepID=A0ABU6MIY7_9BACI|nr:YoaK family protein [Heyndrickxia acidicola]MED1204429.1 YoaK family protein [Heyndrickxia acidicola]